MLISYKSWMVPATLASESGTRAAPREPRSLRYESLTFWRGVACLLIVVYHSILYRHIAGQNFIFAVLHQFWIGVPIFFVISGYCITASADALRSNPLPVRRFFWRRFRRIFPPYWIWLGIMILSIYWIETFISPDYLQCASVPPLHTMTLWRWLGNATLTEPWRTHLAGEPPTVLFWGASWTLCFEEQFYLVVGLILLFARRWLFGAAALLSLLVIAGTFLISGYDQKTWGTFFNCLWLAFAAGVLAYYVLNYVPPQRQTWYCIPLILGIGFNLMDQRQDIYLDGKWILALCAIIAVYIWKRHVPRWRYLFIVPLAAGLGCAFAVGSSSFRIREPGTSEQCVAAFLFALLIIAVKDWDGAINQSRVLSPFRFCGAMCYSLYLVHWPLVAIIAHSFDLLGVTSPAAILLITVPCCVAATLLIAWIFHRLAERRFWNPRI